jgi:hypothetical protein
MSGEVCLAFWTAVVAVGDLKEAMWMRCQSGSVCSGSATFAQAWKYCDCDDAKCGKSQNRLEVQNDIEKLMDLVCGCIHASLLLFA